jgi:hypothetical protein
MELLQGLKLAWGLEQAEGAEPDALACLHSGKPTFPTFF